MASLVCMLKRLAANDYDQLPIGDLVATFVKPCPNFWNLSAIVIFLVTEKSQVLWDWA